jgi:DNA-binding transcriptional ArsR family regulator
MLFIFYSNYLGLIRAHNFNFITKRIKTMKFEGVTAEQLEKVSILLKAIAHPMRIAILQYLDGGKQFTVTEIHEYLKIEQSTTSHHLGILKDKGILGSKRNGKNTIYFLRNEHLSYLVDCINKCAC